MTAVIGMDPPSAGRYPSVGTLILTNQDPSASVILRSARLIGAKHLSVEDAYVMKIGTDDSPFGGGFLVPAGKDGFPDEQQTQKWQSRKQLEGFVLSAGTRVNLLVVVNTDDHCGGTSSGIEVEYRTGEVSQLVSSPTGIEMSNEKAQDCSP